MSDDALDDSQVVAAVLAGQSRLFEVLVNRYQRLLFHVALTRLGKRHLADEVVQETFLAAFRYLPTYKPCYSFRTWLWTILLNQCSQVGARRSETSPLTPIDSIPEDLAAVVDRTALPAEQLEREETAEQLRSLLSELPEREADALRLRFFAQLRFHEIAEIQGCSLGTSKNRVRRALEMLSEKLSNDDIPSVLR